MAYCEYDYVLSDDETFFEGREKRLEVGWLMNEETPHGGLRQLTREFWMSFLDNIGCSILNAVHSEHVDAYLLSESSLFVFHDRMVLKTCGSIQILQCLTTLFEMGELKFETRPSYVFYGHRNFLKGDKQHPPHCSWTEEQVYLKQFFPKGEDKMLGTVDDDRYYLFFWTECGYDWGYDFFEVTMTELSESKMRNFYRGETLESMNSLLCSGLNTLLPDNTNTCVDAYLFDPCGFSLNAVDEKQVYTVHITPQPSCSYISYENYGLNITSPSVDQVCDCFHPRYGTILRIGKGAKYNYHNSIFNETFKLNEMQVSYDVFEYVPVPECS